MHLFKISNLLLCVFVLFAVTCSGCINLKLTENVKVSKDAQIMENKVSIKMDRTSYNYLKLAAKQSKYGSVKEMIQANLSKSIGSENAMYNEVWDNENDKVTISVERSDSYTPAADSKIHITKTDNQIVYEDLSFYADEKPKTTKSPYFNDTQMEQMADVMLSGISVDYYLEMPGKITSSNAATVKDNKAEWHFSGSELTKTKISATSEVPLLPGFTSIFAILALALMIVYVGRVKRQ